MCHLGGILGDVQGRQERKSFYLLLFLLSKDVLLFFQNFEPVIPMYQEVGNTCTLLFAEGIYHFLAA